MNNIHIIIDTGKFTASCIHHFSHPAVLESQLVFPVLFRKCLDYNLTIAQA